MLRGSDAEAHLAEALDRTREQLSTARRELMQRAFFAVPQRRGRLSSL